MGIEEIVLAVGAEGLALHPPENFQVSCVATLDSAAAFGVARQQELLAAALNAPEGLPALKTLAQTHRRVALVVGDLSFPAPYETALLAVLAALQDGGIRPARVSVLACPGHGGPVLGRGAIHRYGEAVVGDYEFRAWVPGENNGPDPLYAAADLRIVVSSAVGGGSAAERLAGLPAPDAVLELTLGQKKAIDIVGARLAAPAATTKPSSAKTVDAEIALTGGGGFEWEGTLEEALLSLHRQPASSAKNATAVLAFSGEDGLGSARFTNDLWALFQQAEELLAGGEALPPPEEEGGWFDAALSVAHALAKFEHLVLLAPAFSEHADAEDLNERLAAAPHVHEHLRFCAREGELWPLLTQWHGSRPRLAVNPLGWRAR